MPKTDPMPERIEAIINGARALRQAAGIFPGALALFDDFRISIAVSSVEMVHLIEMFEASPGLALRSDHGILLFGIRIVESKP